MDSRHPLELKFLEKTRWIRDGCVERSRMTCLRWGYGYEFLLTLFFCSSFSIDGTLCFALKRRQI